MVREETVQGWEAFQEFVSTLKDGEILNIYFTGSKDSNGKSWCPDCVSAEPNVRSGLKHAPKSSIFLQVEVGLRPYWKDTKNPFRTDKNTQLSVIPTLLRWKSHQKLEGAHCENEDLVQMFFSDTE